jgi:hypothetical protein
MLNRLFPLDTLLKRAIIKTIRLITMWITDKPGIHSVISAVVNRFPAVKVRLKRLGFGIGQTVIYSSLAEQDVPMSPQVQAIYLDLLDRIAKREGQ